MTPSPTEQGERWTIYVCKMCHCYWHTPVGGLCARINCNGKSSPVEVVPASELDSLLREIADELRERAESNREGSARTYWNGRADALAEAASLIESKIGEQP